MAKAKNKGGMGVRINAKRVKIGGDVVGGDKTVYQSGSDIDIAQARELISEIATRLDRLEAIEPGQKNQLGDLMQEVDNDVRSETPNPETIVDKLGKFEELLNKVQGIGTTGLGLYTLVENLIKLFAR